MIHKVTAALAVVAVVMTTGWVHARVAPVPIAERDPDAFVPKPAFAKSVAVGFDAVLADFYWLQAVQVVGDDEGNPAAHGTHLGRLIDVATTLNPYMDHPYRFAAMWLTGSPEDVRLANVLLQRSLEYHPHEWRNRFYLGYNLFFYLGENAAAADVLEKAAEMSGSPRYLPRLVARLRSESSNIETAEVFLRQLLADAPDPASRSEYQSALDEIEVEYSARRLDRARESYRKSNDRDIESLADLVSGPSPILARIPAPWPASLPPSFRQGHRWQLDDSGRFFSSYYGTRYEVRFHPMERAKVESWSEDSEEDVESKGDDSDGA